METTQKTLIVASNNSGKIEEIKTIFSDEFPRVLSPREAGIRLDPDETGNSFEENARIKCAAFARYAPDCWILADDSGLAVDALDGAPGVFSARYAGPDADADACIDKLLDVLKDATNRRACFICCVVLRSPDGSVFTAQGRTDGSILTARDGKAGFGYDPVFFSDDLGKSFGRASASEKNAVSHRGRALAQLKERLREI